MGSEGDMSVTLSPGSSSGGARESHEIQHTVEDSNAVSVMSSRSAAAAQQQIHGQQQRWDASNGASLETVEEVHAHVTGAQSVTQQQVSGVNMHEDVWRPY